MIGREPLLPKGISHTLVRRLSAYLPLSEQEQQAVTALEQNARSLPARTKIISEGAPCDRIVIVEAGWLIRSRTLQDGRRQVINVALPGDVLGLDALAFDHASNDISTLTKVVVSCPSVIAIETLFSEFPRLATTFERLVFVEEAALSERLLSIGRRTAVERVSHLLLELWHRLKLVGMSTENALPMPLTQDIIGDALGLSAVHVNRSLKKLQSDGLIEVRLRRPRSIKILDAPKLERLAGFKGVRLQLRPPSVGPQIAAGA